jgi:antitoxin (DNA-binding transcriptional repressor) of toxin-antitoxin stability system
MPHRVVSVTEFKTKCLALLDDIGERGGTITITKRGRPLATVRPARRTLWKSLEGAWVGKVTIPDDLLEADMSELREVVARSCRPRGARRPCEPSPAMTSNPCVSSAVSQTSFAAASSPPWKPPFGQ